MGVTAFRWFYVSYIIVALLQDFLLSVFELVMKGITGIT